MAAKVRNFRAWAKFTYVFIIFSEIADAEGISRA
jgi:hypothetical protein